VEKHRAQFKLGLLMIVFMITSCITPVAAPTGDMSVPEFSQDIPDSENNLEATLTSGFAYDATTLDPARAHPQNKMASMVFKAVYQTLFTHPSGFSGEVVPWLAEEFTLSDDQKNIMIRLRQDAVFTDGASVIAEDVVFSIKRLQNINGSPAHLAQTIQEIVDTDDYNLVIDLTQPDPAIFAKLASGAFSILNKDEVEAHGGSAEEKDTAEDWLNANSAGSGPYILDKWQKESEVSLSRNPNYKELPELEVEKERAEQVIIRYIPNSTTQLEALQAGEIDIALNLMPTQRDAIRGISDIMFQEDFSGELLYLYVRQDSENSESLLNAPRFHAAIRHALNYKEIQEIIDGSTELPASFIPKGFFGALEEESSDRYNPERAKELLNEIGAENLHNNTFTLGYRSSMVGIDVDSLVSQIQTDLSMDGEGLNIELTPNNDEADIFLYRTGPAYMNSIDYLKLPKDIDWENRPDDLIQQAEQASDPEELENLLADVQNRFIDDFTGSRYAILAQPGFTSAARAGITGFNLNPQGVVYIRRISSKGRWCALCVQICNSSCNSTTCKSCNGWTGCGVPC